jgi:hypothetical protein
MAKNIYEIFDEFENAHTKQEKINVIQKNINQTLINVLLLTFHPDYEWLVNDFPMEYKIPDTLPGISTCQLSTELRKLYLFRKGDHTAENLSERKRKELLIQFLESLEPREAEVLIGIFKKDQGVKGLTYEFVSECFPDMLPKRAG